MSWFIFSIIVFIAGLLDAFKSRFITKKVLRYKSSKGTSRMFINVGIIHKILLTIWAVFYLRDWVVALSSLVALYMTIELWWAVYLNYNYLGRGRFGFKRPSVLNYIWNSLLPNCIVKRM